MSPPWLRTGTSPTLQACRLPTSARFATASRPRSASSSTPSLTRSTPTAPHTSCASPKMLPVLADEFAGRRTDEEIRACADAILCRYDDVPVRSYTTILATRQARECVRADVCDALSAN